MKFVEASLTLRKNKKEGEEEEEKEEEEEEENQAASPNSIYIELYTLISANIHMKNNLFDNFANSTQSFRSLDIWTLSSLYFSNNIIISTNHENTTSFLTC